MNFIKLHNGTTLITFEMDGSVLFKFKVNNRSTEGFKDIKEYYQYFRFSKSEWKAIEEVKKRKYYPHCFMCFYWRKPFSLWADVIGEKPNALRGKCTIENKIKDFRCDCSCNKYREVSKKTDKKRWLIAKKIKKKNGGI